MAATTTTFQVGTYNPLTDAFTSVLDLNDFNTFWIEKGSMKMDQPKKEFVRAFNIRTPGDPIFRYQYHNRHIMVSLRLRGASTTAILSSIRTLLSAIEKPPYVLRIQLPGGTQFSYADVVAVEHNIPTDPQVLLALAVKSVQISFECKPGLRGDRVYLQNLVMNPGFEAPSSAPVVAFNDSLATMNAYTPQQYLAAVQTDTPIRLYQMQEASGTTATDTGSQATNATYTGGFTLAQYPGPLGGSIGGVTLNGTTGYLSVPTTSLPSGSSAFTVECLFFVSVTPTTSMMLCQLGNTTSGQFFSLQTTTSGKLQVLVGATSVTGGVNISAGWHHAVGFYDGTNIGGYLDGTSLGTATAVALSTTYGGAAFGAKENASGQFLGGELAFCAIYSGALSAARVTAHYNASVPAALSVATNLLTVPTGAQFSFGSPAWGPINTWSVRWKWVTGLTATWYLHYTNATNYLAITTTNGTMTLVHVVGGTTHTLQSVAPTLTTGNFYWLQVSQFPAIANNNSYVAGTLFNDSAGAVGAAVASGAVGAATFDAVTALIGKPQILASGATLVIGGAFANVHTVSLFGPGGWQLLDSTSVNSYGWDTTPANTYPNGPVTSVAAARIDFGPAAVAANAAWCVFNAGSPTGTTAIPVIVPGQVIYASVWIKTSGLGASGQVALYLREFNAAGTLLRQTALQVATGNQPSWTQLAGHVATGANCAFVDTQLNPNDATIGSGGATIWFDNVQCWNWTLTGGATTMPYCEIRFPATPASLMVSGIVGDIAAPVFAEIGTYFASWATGHTANLYMGRRAISTASLPMASWPAVNAVNPFVYAFTLDSASYGGFYLNTTLGSADRLQPQVVSSAGVQPSGTDAMGAFHVLSRIWSADLTPASVSTVTNASQSTVSGQYPTSNIVGPSIFALSAGSTWTMCDDGPITLPPFPAGTLVDNTQIYLRVAAQYVGSAATRQAFHSGWHALIPIDGELVIANMINPSNAVSNVTQQYLYTYIDGIGLTTTYSVESVAFPSAYHAGGSYGSSTTSSVSVNADADPWLRFDPTLAVGANAGVNQFGVLITDDAATVLNVAVDFFYSPLYLYPR